MQVGVDEAGKGPVLGSMFVAGVRSQAGLLPADVQDSKRLSAEQRETLVEGIRSAAEDVAVFEVPVERIDDPDTDMNTLTLEAHREILDRLATSADACFLDAADTDASRFQARVSEDCPATSVTATHGADESHRIVAAASIVAKVARDRHVAELATRYGDIGSGYPGDKRTRQFLQTYVAETGSLPACARTSWQTSRDLLASEQQQSLSEF